MDSLKDKRHNDRLAKYENSVPALDQSLRLLLHLKSHSDKKMSLHGDLQSYRYCKK